VSRSSDPRNIFKDPKPTRKPWLFGRIPSRTGGHQVDVSFGVTPEGQMVAETIGDNGRMCDITDPFAYLALFGSEMTMTPEDIREFLAGVQEGRQERIKREGPRPVPTQQQLKQYCADLIDAVKDVEVGRTKFGWTGEKTW
jgi:hypothetical protein